MFQEGVTSVYIVSENGHSDCVKALIDAWADINQADKEISDINDISCIYTKKLVTSQKVSVILKF